MENQTEARSNPTYREPLGVGGILGQTFATLFSKFGAFFLMALVPLLIAGWIGTLIGPAILEQIISDLQTSGSPSALLLNPLFLMLVLAILVTFNLITAAITAATYDSLTGRPLRFVSYYLRAFRAMLPIVILGIVVIVILTLGVWLLMLVVGSFVPILGAVAVVVYIMYIMACFYVLIPVIVIERGGFAALSRTLEATKGYRWPIAGLIFVTGILSNIFSWLIEKPATSVMEAFSPGLWGFLTLSAVAYAFVYAAGAILSALVYARLREIKQGVGLEDLAEVFR